LSCKTDEFSTQSIHCKSVSEAAPVISLGPWCNASEDYNQPVFLLLYSVCWTVYTGCYVTSFLKSQTVNTNTKATKYAICLR